ncbi:hypothetical protein [Pseudoduganella aquatica]|uniref:VCBS repeat-containing protein n=1 Tax=Pseudoduganella aquatica TaxID=2660641 RepID=A0A7X4KN20_9BURK|nr:hypothetical protein [Pseudoduganella aquatica]MYN08728.1 hypothetical protein [Pseudoduganella aquatica]
MLSRLRILGMCGALALHGALQAAPLKRPRPPDENGAIFAKQGSTLMPLARLANRHIVDFNAPGNVEQQQSYLNQHYFNESQTLYVLAGEKTTTGSMGPAGEFDRDDTVANCPVTWGVANHEGELPFATLATNYFALSADPTAPRPADYAVLDELATPVLRAAGISSTEIARALAQMRSENESLQTAVALPLLGSSKPLLLANLGGDDGPKHTYTLTLIAEPDQSGKYGMVFHRLNQMARAKKVLFASAFMSNADLDGDGQDEIAITDYTGDSSSFRLLQRVSGTWKLVATAPGPHCMSIRRN